MTFWDCRTHVLMTSMTSSVERTDLDFKISVALIRGDLNLYLKDNTYRYSNQLLRPLGHADSQRNKSNYDVIILNMLKE